MPAVIQVKRGSASSWTSANTVLAAGEIGFETDTKKMKVGDGSTAWTSLGYTATDGDISGVTAGTGLSGGGTSGAVTLNLSTPVATTNGGTGLSSFTTGDLVYASGSNTLAARSIGSTDQVLTVSGGLPVWAAPAGGSNVKIHYANPSADFSSSSATTVDMTGYSITFTPTSATNNIIISASLSFGFNGQIEHYVYVDGVIEHRFNYYSNTNANQKASTSFRLQNLSATSHTVKLSVRPDGVSYTAYGSSSFDFKNNNLMIQEIY